MLKDLRIYDPQSGRLAPLSGGQLSDAASEDAPPLEDLRRTHLMTATVKQPLPLPEPRAVAVQPLAGRDGTFTVLKITKLELYSSGEGAAWSSAAMDHVSRASVGGAGAPRTKGACYDDTFTGMQLVKVGRARRGECGRALMLRPAHCMIVPQMGGADGAEQGEELFAACLGVCDEDDDQPIIAPPNLQPSAAELKKMAAQLVDEQQLHPGGALRPATVAEVTPTTRAEASDLADWLVRRAFYGRAAVSPRLAT